MASASLLLGPVLRHVGATSASIWLQTSAPATVEILGCTARTFTVAGHHYALVGVTGLEPATVTSYQVHIDGQQAWPRPGSAWPDSRIRTRGDPHRPVRVVFGSCRRAKPDDPRGAALLGVDALDVYAGRMMRVPPDQWPDVLLLLGDQIYADDPSPQTRRWLAARRDTRQPPWHEVADFTEYARLYAESWADEEVRWLMSTVPVAMIFDDHDVRDDWNTSAAWREWVLRQPWWPERIRGGLVSYWVYQHLGNLSPAELAADPNYRAVLEADGDAWPVLARMADRADADPATVRWSYRWDLDNARLVVVDTRAARMLAEGARSMLDEDEFAWVERAVSDRPDGTDHVLIGSSLPVLLPPVIDDVQAINEVACGRGSRRAEWLRQTVDMEHWAAFRTSFERILALLDRVASAPKAPATISVLSGDVHHSYAARLRLGPAARSAVYQLVCSPVHHAVPLVIKPLLRLAWWRPLARLTGRLARRAGVRAAPASWSRLTGPHVGNALSTVRLDGRGARLRLERAGLRDGRPALRTVTTIELTEPGRDDHAGTARPTARRARRRTR